MDIQGAFRSLSGSFRDYYRETERTTASLVLRFKELRNNPDFFQKVCQVAFASLQLIIMRYPGANSLSRFAFVLQTANMHDFYRFIQLPRKWFFPIDADVIEENVVLEDLVNFLYQANSPIEPEDVEDNLAVGDDEWEDLSPIVPAPRGIIEDVEEKGKLRELLRECLGAQLKQMDSTNDAYRSLDEFKKVLENRLSKLKDEDFNKYHFSTIQLENLKRSDLSALSEQDTDYHVSQWIRHVPLAQKILNVNWAILDIGCVGLYLHGWQLVDTAKWAEKVGEYPAFQWVNNQHLDRWVVGLVCTGFLLKLFESCRKLRDEALTSQEKRDAQWNAATSVTELILFGSIFMNQIGMTKVDNVYIQCFAIGSKSFGLLNIMLRPPHQFFEQPEA